MSILQDPGQFEVARTWGESLPAKFIRLLADLPKEPDHPAYWDYIRVSESIR